MSKDQRIRYVCHRCALEAPTCCRLGPDQLVEAGGGHDCFPLSNKEHTRIVAALATARGKGSDAGSLLLRKTAAQAADHPTGTVNWHVDEANSPRFVGAMLHLFPKDKARIKQVFPEGGTHMRLALRADGGCVFLSEHGCTLPRQVRPRFCRIFPFWSVGGNLQCFQAEDCLAVREHGNNFMALLGMFDSSPEEVMDRYKNLRLDWGVD